MRCSTDAMLVLIYMFFIYLHVYVDATPQVQYPKQDNNDNILVDNLSNGSVKGGRASTVNEARTYISNTHKRLREYHESIWNNFHLHHCRGDRNATYKTFPDPCPPTCRNPNGVPNCYKMYMTRGCECKPGFVLSDTGYCILYDDCPDVGCNGDRNAILTECPSSCPRTCELPNGPDVCNKMCLATGCECKDGYVLNQDGICVALQDCPDIGCNGDLNATLIECPSSCPRTCELPNGPDVCNKMCLATGCECKDGYVLNEDGICVALQDCPDVGCNGDRNAILTECPSSCPRTCELPNGPDVCNKMCLDTGCECKDGYVLNQDGICVALQDCPGFHCGPNEVLSSCGISCPPKTCDSIFTTYNCENHICEVGCDCIDGYLRNRDGLCVLSEDCFLEPTCEIIEQCRSTCANPTPNCAAVQVPTENVDGCKCMQGYILTDVNGQCIKIEDCPDNGCNGDPNAVVTTCPWPCPSSCDSPNASSCGQSCASVGCQCKPSYLLHNGICIMPDECPLGNPCGINGTYSDCSFRCPNQYCPEDDSLITVACKPGRPCPPGCICLEYYRIASYYDNSCVLASDCQPLICSRSYEEYDSCASECLAEDCNDLETISTCVPDPNNCQPKCVCIEDYYRDALGDCIPRDQCL